MKLIEATSRRAVERLFQQHRERDRALERRVRTIVETVRLGGDRAVIRYARRFDGLRGPLEITPEQITAGAREAPRAVRDALEVAARHIRTVARAQLPASRLVRVADGLTVEQRVTPLDRVGCYVPGGRYPLPSSLLMTAIPARVAGVREVIAVCPRAEPAVLAAAAEAGVTRLFQVGGAHAIAALAYGTASIPMVDKIVGPGSRYVAAAKALVSSDCAIDFHAGPTEVVIVSDEAPPAWIAADLLAQAEHDPDARAILITTRRDLAVKVRRELAARMPDGGPARRALDAHGAIVITRNRADAVALANRLAPEHLLCDDEEVAAAITCAGTIFVGPGTVPAAGDYATGSNHVLPTAGAARFRGGLNSADFVRVIALQRMTARALARLAGPVITLARAEGLHAHAASVEARLA
jgi:histidinol dehydrogenase